MGETRVLVLSGCRDEFSVGEAIAGRRRPATPLQARALRRSGRGHPRRGPGARRGLGGRERRHGARPPPARDARQRRRGGGALRAGAAECCGSWRWAARPRRWPRGSPSASRPWRPTARRLCAKVATHQRRRPHPPRGARRPRRGVIVRRAAGRLNGTHAPGRTSSPPARPGVPRATHAHAPRGRQARQSAPYRVTSPERVAGRRRPRRIPGSAPHVVTPTFRSPISATPVTAAHEEQGAARAPPASRRRRSAWLRRAAPPGPGRPPGSGCGCASAGAATAASRASPALPAAATPCAGTPRRPPGARPRAAPGGLPRRWRPQGRSAPRAPRARGHPPGSRRRAAPRGCARRRSGRGSPGP